MPKKKGAGKVANIPMYDEIVGPIDASEFEEKEEWVTLTIALVSFSSPLRLAPAPFLITATAVPASVHQKRCLRGEFPRHHPSVRRP